MIKSFRDKQSECIFQRKYVKKFSANVQRLAYRKLLVLDAVERLNDLNVPPGTRLEKLSGDREGQLSIRINEQWRICFKWHKGDAYEVEITDYH